MKKFFKVLLWSLLLLFVALNLNLLRYHSQQVSYPSVSWDHPSPDAAIERLSASIRFQTISGDMSVPTDSVEFRAFLNWAEEAFPRVHATFQRTMIGGLTPVFKWEGRNAFLDPIVLMGHYDVVPVEAANLGEWVHPPFSGAVSDGFVWGRGTMDDKFTVIGLLEAAETLLAEGFIPERTIWFSFGHDEEIGGPNGAASVARWMQEQGIRAKFVLDEGGSVMDGMLPVDRPVALVGVAEKGYISLRLSVQSPGGHSSMPPRETAVGILAEAITKLQDNPFPGSLDGVVDEMFRFVGPEMGYSERLIFGNLWITRRLAAWLLSKTPSTDATLRTTTAPTMLSGSQKDNVMPAVAEGVVNFRIIPGETTETVMERVRKVINDDRVEISKYGEFTFNPSPVSPTDGPGFEIIRKTISQTMGQPHVAPYLVMGGTDARYFYAISDQVFRFMPIVMNSEDLSRFHGVNERVSAEDYLRGIGFYRQLIMNAQ